ncbi:MAG: hypothetical protein ACRDGA_10010, partial [Bacteroidota bacterium]
NLPLMTDPLFKIPLIRNQRKREIAYSRVLGFEIPDTETGLPVDRRVQHDKTLRTETAQTCTFSPLIPISNSYRLL